MGVVSDMGVIGSDVRKDGVFGFLWVFEQGEI
jgi:hypothetical protein